MGWKRDQSYTLFGDTTRFRNTQGGDSVVNYKRIVREDSTNKEGGNRELGFATYIHFYYKFSSWINPAITLGAGLGFTKTIRPRYFTGVSLLIGSNNRLCINGGLVWGNYEDLSNKYEKYKVTDNTYTKIPDSETALNVQTRFRNAGFISVSYNFPFLQRKKKTEAAPSSSTSNNGSGGGSGTAGGNGK